jgi:hypothetical protein
LEDPVISLSLEARAPLTELAYAMILLLLAKRQEATRKRHPCFIVFCFVADVTDVKGIVRSWSLEVVFWRFVECL